MAKTAYQPVLFLWKQRTMFIGSIEPPLVISTGSALLIFSLDKPIFYRPDGVNVSIKCQSLLIPAGVEAVITAKGATVAVCTLDPFGADVDQIKRAMQHRVGHSYYQFKGECRQVEILQAILRAPTDKQTMLSLFVESLKPKATSPYQIDPRIVKAIDLIHKTVDENLTLSDLEHEVGLAPSRLTELFKQQTGLPIRRFRLWHRLYTTVLARAEGKTLTEAAIESGFNDSSHFNRTFRSMLGVTPRCLFSKANLISVDVPDRHKCLN